MSSYSQAGCLPLPAQGGLRGQKSVPGLPFGYLTDVFTDVAKFLLLLGTGEGMKTEPLSSRT